MPLLPFGEWKPDVTDYEGQATKNVLNVLPRGDGYGPFKAFASATSALPSACRGLFYAVKPDGSVQVFAGTSAGLYTLDNTTLGWVNTGKLANCTISNASPGVVTYTNTFAANDPVVFAAGGGTLPSQIVAGTVYYVSATGLSGSSFSVSATAGGARINTSGGSGTVQVTSYYSSLSSTAQWQFVQAGNFVFATQANAALQVYTLASSSQFRDAAGSPPQAAYISVVGRFLVLSGLLSLPFRIQWSGRNNWDASDSWTSGISESDHQDFADGGIVRGVAGGEFGTIFQDQTIRRMSYIPGSSVIFQIERVTKDLGLFAPYSIISAGPLIYFYASQGFYKIPPGGFPEQIGRERIDRTFFDDLDRTNLQLFIGAPDPRSSRIYWAYKSSAGAANLYDKLLGYDIALDRFFPLSATGEYLTGISQPSITLDALDTITGGTTYSITGAANNGSGLIRITVGSTTGLSNGSTLTITGIVGTTEANRTWVISGLTGTTFDLVGSTFTNAYVSGGTANTGSIDALTLTLDAYASSVQPQLSQCDSTHKMGFFTGANLEATLETGEQGTDGERIYVNGFRPVTDAATFYGSASFRETVQDSAISTAEVARNSRTGRCNLRKSTRYSRFKVRIPSATTWSYCAGVEPDTSLDGET